MTVFPAVEFGAVNIRPLTALLQRALVFFAELLETRRAVCNRRGREGPLKRLGGLHVELDEFVKADLDAAIAQARPLCQPEKGPP